MRPVSVCLPNVNVFAFPTKWVTASVSVVLFFFVPALSGVSDNVGRRAVIGGALLLNSVGVFTLAVSHDNLISVTVCHLLVGLSTVITPVSQAVMIDVAE